MNRVFVLSQDGQPLDPCHPARARKLLRAGKAAVFRHFPFTIALKQRTVSESVTHPHRVKIDPGSRVSGIAVVQEENKALVWAAELNHRGHLIHRRMHLRSLLRRARRSRKNRYRPSRYLNRRQPEGHLRPSLHSRVANIQTWVGRLWRYCPASALTLEFTKFDMQKMVNPEIRGVEYCQGELQGYEVREYLLEKWGRACAYCGATNIPLQVEHVIPASRGGSNRVSNLALSCRPCNLKKGSMTAAEFGYPAIQEQAKQSLRDAAAVSAIRWALLRAMQTTGLPLEVGTGAQTKLNRRQQGYSKTHWMDAACAGQSGGEIALPVRFIPLFIVATGHGKRQRCRTNKYGFPITHASRAKKAYGYQTGDIAKASTPRRIHMPAQIGRVVIRHYRPMFMLNRRNVHPKYLTLLQRADGYHYQQGMPICVRTTEKNQDGDSTDQSLQSARRPDAHVL